MRKKLNDDGAAWSCTFIFDGWECPKEAHEALTEDAHQKLKDDKRLKNVSFLRALCPTHLIVLEPYLIK